MRVSYNEYADLVEIYLKDGDGSLGSEEEDNVVVFKNQETGEVTGYAILDFAHTIKECDLEKFPWVFDYKKDLLPRLKRKGLI